MFYKKLNGDGNNENTNSNPYGNKSREFWEKKYGVGYKVKFIVRMRYDFIKSELLYFGCEERYDNIQKRSQENASNAPSLEAPWKKWITGILDKSF